MNKKLLTLLVGLMLVAVLVSCNFSNLFKGKEEVPPPQQEEQETQPPPPPEETKPVTPPKKPVTPPPKDTTKPADKTTTGTAGTEEAVTEPVPKAGLGVIFVTNVRTGAFRVKIDDEKVIDHSFAGKKGGKAEEMRFERELKFEPGERKFKFVCEDNQGSKGVKEMALVFNPGQHKVVKIIVKGSPGDIKLEILE
jgi:hypothetical protein